MPRMVIQTITDGHTESTESILLQILFARIYCTFQSQNIIDNTKGHVRE